VGVLLGWSTPGSISNWLIENLIVNNGGHGVEIWTPGATGNAIINNKIFGNNGQGIFAKGRNSLLYSNWTINNSVNGIKLEFGDNSIAVRNCIKANCGDGIDISSDENLAYANLVKKNLGSGIQINGDENIVQKNLLIGNEEGGDINNNCNNSIFDNQTGIGK
jgi:hypothetical protein